MEIEDPVSEMSEDITSELASVYLVFTISSSKGVRNDTFFSAWKRGRIDILRRLARGWSGLLASTEFRTCDMEYGIVAEFKVDAELTDDELGVLESRASASSVGFAAGWTELSIASRGRVGRPKVVDRFDSGS
jgi:hypothetical protein